MNKNKKGILLALCLVLAVPVCGSGLPAQATSMSSITSDSIREKQDQINQAQKERETMKSNLSNLEQIKKDLETKKSNLKSYVAQLDQNLSEIEQNIADLKSKITAKEEEITQTQAELDAAQAKEDAQKDAMIRRIRVMYEKGDSYILDMMLKAESFSDFLNRADFMDLVMAYDRQQWKEFMENRKYIALCKEELEAEKQILDEAKAGVEQEQANMEALIDQKSRDITAYESDISNKEQAIKEYKQSIADQDAEIAALEAAIAAEKKRILEASGTVLTYDGGVFPCMEELLLHLKSKNFQKRTVGLMENGSWAPLAGKIMRGILEPMKDVHVREQVVTIKSAVHDDTREAMKAMADALK